MRRVLALVCAALLCLSGAAAQVGRPGYAPGFRPGFQFLGSSSVVFQYDYTTGALPSAVTDTRAAPSANYYNLAGTSSFAGANIARFDYNPSTLTARGLLTEESRQNVVLQSNFQSGWTNGNVTSTLNAATGVDGASSATRLTDNTTSGTHSVYNVFTAQASTNALSVDAKAETLRYLTIANADTNGSGGYAVLDAQTGAITQSASIGSGSLVSSKVVALPNGWFRATVVATFSANSDPLLGLANAATYTAGSFGRQTYAGTGQSLLVQNLQLEAGTFATSRIPTTSAAATRAADSLAASAPLSTYLANGPSVLETQDIATGTTSRTAYAAGGFTWPQSKWVRYQCVYAAGTDTSTKLTPGSGC